MMGINELEMDQNAVGIGEAYIQDHLDLEMDQNAVGIVEEYIQDHLDKSDPLPEDGVYIVWKCKTLQKWKYLLASMLFYGMMYYELTFNCDKCEWCLVVYKEFENRVISCGE